MPTSRLPFGYSNSQRHFSLRTRISIEFSAATALCTYTLKPTWKSQTMKKMGRIVQTSSSTRLCPTGSALAPVLRRNLTMQ